MRRPPAGGEGAAVVAVWLLAAGALLVAGEGGPPPGGVRCHISASTCSGCDAVVAVSPPPAAVPAVHPCWSITVVGAKELPRRGPAEEGAPSGMPGVCVPGAKGLPGTMVPCGALAT